MDNIEDNRGLNSEALDCYRVMIVDDSAFIRGAIARAIESDPTLHIVSSVCNGEQAINSLRREPVDVIVLDIEMPVMDGLTALPQLKAIDDAVQIIMASTLTQKNAEISLRAMSLGATDYIPKPSSGHEVMGALGFKEELVLKIKVLGALAQRMGVRETIIKRPLLPSGGEPSSPKVSPPVRQITPTGTVARERPQITPTGTVRERSQPSVLGSPLLKKQVVLRKELIRCPELIAIGSSTGGPQALFKVIKDMGKDLSQPVVVTQHMPAAFTSILADHISRQCDVVCTEARDGDILVSGHYYIAPGDFHMLIETKTSGPTVRLVKDPPENFCRPAVDPMLRSLSKIYGAKMLVIILTGMGQDGMKGCDIVVRNGGAVIAQDEVTSVVWGMPGAVAMAGLCTAVLPLPKIGEFVRQTAIRNRA